MILKRINDELARALESEPVDKVLIGRIARKLELHISSAGISTLDIDELKRASQLSRAADRTLKGITSSRFEHRGMKFGIGRKWSSEPGPDQLLKTAIVQAKQRALTSSRSARKVRPEEIPSIIHCTWAGGGAIATVKSLKGIESWLKHTDYQVFVWWDSSRLFNMHVRRLLKASPEVRRLYDESATRDRLKIRKVVEIRGHESFEYDVEPGSNRHNHRFLTQYMTNSDVKFEMTKELWDEVEHDLHPLRELAEEWPGRLVLCDVRSKALSGRADWCNLEFYERELTLRGMFAAAASDILRYEVLYNFGGVYMDVDIELTDDIGTLRAHPDSMLVGITPDRAGKATFVRWEGRRRIACTSKYDNKCLYISNCIVAACPESRAMQAVRETIHLAYACMAPLYTSTLLRLDPGRVIRKFWHADTTRSTLDLTGPNVVREVLLQIQLGEHDWDSIPHACVTRLVRDLESHRTSISTIPKDFDSDAFRRLAYVWRDDNRSHLEFWKWVSNFAVFPMANTVCDTEAAERSDCRTASNQLRKHQLKSLELKKIHPYIPRLPSKGVIRGLYTKLHEQYGQSTPLPPDLRVGQRFIWAHALWKVTSLETRNKKDKLLPPEKWKIALTRIG